MEKKVLAINPGSTSTKIALFDGQVCLFEEIIDHSAEVLVKYPKIMAQLEARSQLLKDVLSKRQVDLASLDGVVGRGGLLYPMASGTYLVNQVMKDDLVAEVSGAHASNLGAFMAAEIAESIGVSAFIVDPVVVDELQPVARFSGNQLFERRSVFHALNQKAVARKVASQLNRKYQDLRLIVVHLGGGISIGAHLKGRVIDVNNALDGEGPFSPERSGSLPMADFLAYALANQEKGRSTLLQEVVGRGGLVSYLGTNDLRTVEAQITQGDPKAEAVFQALVYQVAKCIGEQAIVLKGQIDGVILTGGLAFSQRFVAELVSYIEWLGPVFVEGGEDEMNALNEGVQRVLSGQEEAKTYLGRMDD